MATKKRGVTREQLAVGTKVFVTHAVDRACDPEVIGRTGVVIGFVVGDHGATEADPLVLVKYRVPGDRRPRRDGFWMEEMLLWTAARERASRAPRKPARRHPL